MPIALEIGGADKAATTEHARAVDPHNQPPAGQPNADALTIELTQAHGQILIAIVQARLVAWQGVFTQITIEQAFDGVPLGFTIKGALMQGSGGQSKGHAGISREVMSRGRAKAIAATAARQATRKGEAMPHV